MPDAGGGSTAGQTKKVGTGWRYIAIYLSRELRTPVPYVLQFSMVDASRWVAALNAYMAEVNKDG